MKKRILICIAIIAIIACSACVLVACDDLNSYIVILDGKGNEPISFEYVEEGAKIAEPSEPTKDGYTFVCWKNAADGKEWNFEEDTVTANTVLYAEWQEIEGEPEISMYLVVLDGKGNEPISFEYVEEGAKIAEPSEPTKDGYTFVCWKNAADDKEWNFAEDTITANTVLYAEWREIEKEPEIHLVILDNQNGEPAQFYLLPEGAQLGVPDDVEKDGFEFVAWINIIDGSEWDFDNDVITGTTVLYATWIEKHLVTFDNGDGTIYTQFYVLDGGKIEKPEVPTSSIKTFQYWKNVATGEAWDFEEEVTSSVELCAVWKSDFIMPCNGTVLTKYSATFVWNSTLQQLESHTAIDFVSEDLNVVNVDLNVFAVKDGVITQVGYDGLSGYFVVIEHADGYVSKYLSLEETTLEVGTQVEQGQIIGTMSDSMGSEYKKGVHLHFEMTKDGKYIDPAEIIDLDEE